jgi:hypothetical protein
VIDTVAPTAVSNLATSQVKLGNDGDGTTKVTVTFTAPLDAATVEVYRAGFGQYPEYDDAGGSVPAAPTYPPVAPWVLTGVTASGQTDEVGTRDFWYYAVFTKDACGNVSLVSNATTGTLNYHLGDVANGITLCQGNNAVNTADMSLLGAHYGATLVVSDSVACLDVGPTTSLSVDARPTTDNQVQFEDLILFAINFGQVSKARVHQEPASRDELRVLGPGSVEANETLTALLWAQGSGRIQGLSARLTWDAAVVEYVGMTAGELLELQEGVALTPSPGVVDVALLGARSQGLAGEGTLAEVRFRALRQGDPRLALASVDARDAGNRAVEVQSNPAEGGPEGVVPAATQLLANVPNPFNPTTRLSFTLVAAGPVELAIFTVDGRRVRTLLQGERGAGLHAAIWDGCDDGGVRLASGTYYARLVTGQGTRTRPLVMFK